MERRAAGKWGPQELGAGERVGEDKTEPSHRKAREGGGQAWERGAGLAETDRDERGGKERGTLDTARRRQGKRGKGQERREGARSTDPRGRQKGRQEAEREGLGVSPTLTG